jgi:hypothetical protein
VPPILRQRWATSEVRDRSTGVRGSRDEPAERDNQAPRGSIPPRGVHRPWRNGDRLARPRRGSRPARGCQGGPLPASARRAGAGGAAQADSARGSCHRQPEPPERRHYLRRGRGGRASLHRDGAAPGLQPE